MDQLNEQDVFITDVIKEVENPPLTEITQIGDLEGIGLGLTWWWPSDLGMRFMEFLYVTTGLPWWGTIVCASLVMRIVLLPINIRVARNASILPYIIEEQDKIRNEAKNPDGSLDNVKYQIARIKMKSLHNVNNYSIGKAFLGLLQIPFLLAMFVGIKNLLKFPAPGVGAGGTLWFTDLTYWDPYFILPMLSGVFSSLTLMVAPPMLGMLK